MPARRSGGKRSIQKGAEDGTPAGCCVSWKRRLAVRDAKLDSLLSLSLFPGFIRQLNRVDFLKFRCILSVAFNAVFYCSYSRLSFYGMQLLEQLSVASVLFCSVRGLGLLIVTIRPIGLYLIIISRSC